MVKIIVMFDIVQRGNLERLYCKGTINIENKGINDLKIKTEISKTLNGLPPKYIVDLKWEIK